MIAILAVLAALQATGAEGGGDITLKKAKKKARRWKKVFKQAARQLVAYYYDGGRNPRKIARFQEILHVPRTGYIDTTTEARVLGILGWVDWTPEDKAARRKKKKKKKKKRRPAKKRRPKKKRRPGAEETAPTPAPRFLTAPAATPTRDPEFRRTRFDMPTDPVFRTTRFEPVPAAEPEPAPELNRRQRNARALREYVEQGGTNRSEIAVFQRGMKRLDPDGHPGPKTQRRASKLGFPPREEWPNIMPGGPPSIPKRRMAARELRAYLDVYGGKRKDRIRAYQKRMGGITADGIAGRKTRARIAEILGE
jgi:hypothetical protein